MKYLKIFFSTAAALVTVVLLVYLSLAWYVAKTAEVDTKTRSDAILVLGARSYINGAYNPCLFSRVLYAVNLYSQGYASKIIMSGGNDLEDGVNEAETMQKIAGENGIPPENILLEKSATSTYENLTLTKKIMTDNNLNSVIIVTEPFHTPRASLTAQKLGLNYTISPATQSPCWQPNKYLSKYFLKEPIAILAYKLQQKI